MTQIQWLGHATVLIDLGHTRILTDPVLGARVAHLTRRTPAPAAPQRIDAVLLSHLHYDHADRRSLQLLGSDVPIIAPAGTRTALRRIGGHPIHELALGDTYILPGGPRVTAVPACHGSRRHPFAREAVQPIGFVVEDDRRIYFAGDTDLFSAMAEIGRPGLDLALLPVWGWGPSLGEGHLDPERAARAAALLRPRVAVPIHWATFLPQTTTAAHAAPLLTEPGPAFARYASEFAPEVTVAVLPPGASLEL
jgi:L-ascorbate metabolism protein UlaG (beta-lactamase superfamily)